MREGKDDLGDRMKAYEAVETGRRFDLGLPVYARLDGRGFSNFTRGLEKPFDFNFHLAMVETAVHLLRETHARIAYVQSDEISLVWERPSEEGQIFFDGKAHKIMSVLASMAAARFAVAVSLTMATHVGKFPHFDCRAFSLPDRTEAANCVLWRALDARKNGVSQLAHAHYSHRDLQNVNRAGMIEMLRHAGVIYSDVPARFTRGVFLRREVQDRVLTSDELARIPVDKRPTGPVQRSFISRMEGMPPFWMVENRVGVIFDGEDPVQFEACKEGE